MIGKTSQRYLKIFRSSHEDVRKTVESARLNYTAESIRERGFRKIAAQPADRLHRPDGRPGLFARDLDADHWAHHQAAQDQLLKVLKVEEKQSHETDES